jgi:hypothetical protein
MGACGAPGARSGRRDVSATAGGTRVGTPDRTPTSTPSHTPGGLDAAPTPTRWTRTDVPFRVRLAGWPTLIATLHA